jgi:hypothetical protein
MTRSTPAPISAEPERGENVFRPFKFYDWYILAEEWFRINPIVAIPGFEAIEGVG